MADVTIPGHHGDIPAYLATPEGDGPWPAVLVIHDALGLSDDIRSQADWLAAAGYLAAAPDLYHWGSRMKCLFSTVREIAKGEGRAFDDVEAVRTWLVNHGSSTGKVGVIGFCMGGGFAVMLTPGDRYDAASVNYGGLPKDAETLLADACPIVGSYGGRDLTLRSAPGTLNGILVRNDIPHDVKVYPEAGHAFMNRIDYSAVPAIFRIAGKMSRSEYVDDAAIDARRRIVAFFDEHLRG
jgi:carboxymethylenebutenolidase